VMTEGLVGRRVVPHTLLWHVGSNIGVQWLDIHSVVSKLISSTLM
jgi:hypothetical protein